MQLLLLSFTEHEDIFLHLYTRKVKVLSLPETIKEKSTFRAKALRRELVVREPLPSLENVDFSFIVSGSERTFTFHVSLNTLPTLATLVRDISAFIPLSTDFSALFAC